MDEEFGLNSTFFQNRKLKSFIRVGTTFIDIKETIGFSFIRDKEPNGYIIIQFVYDTGRGLNAYMKNRNDFAHFLIELEPFIDDENVIGSMEKFIINVETELGITKPTIYKKKRKYKSNEKRKGENF